MESRDLGKLDKCSLTKPQSQSPFDIFSSPLLCFEDMEVGVRLEKQQPSASERGTKNVKKEACVPRMVGSKRCGIRVPTNRGTVTGLHLPPLEKV